MANTQEAAAVKCLNTGPSGKRFIFKPFAQRVGEIEIDVFHSLDPVKAEPSAGSSFFRDCLVQWRELNTAEDFISFHDSVTPVVQTLPQILLHRERIFSELTRRLHIGAKLSLEPLLMLVAALSRDVLEEFLPFLPRLAGSLVGLLKNGGDRDPEILEQIFTSWSFIIMYLQKYLTKDVVHVLKITSHLRYFPKDYVQEFMAEAMSFLIRNSSSEQLTRGIRKIIHEASKNPSSSRKAGVTSLLWHVLRGTSSRLHSRAEKVLRLLLDKSTFSIGDKFDHGTEAVLEVMTGIIYRMCKEVDHKEVNILHNCLFEEVSNCLSDGCLVHLDRLLHIFTFTVCSCSGKKYFDIQKVLGLISLLVTAYIVPNGCVKSEDQSFKVINSILQLMLCILDLPFISDVLPSITLLYAPAFKLKNSSVLLFIKGLIVKDPCVLRIFRGHIISTINDYIEALPEEVIFLMMTFFERLEIQQSCDNLHDVPEDKILNICNFFKSTFVHWSKLMRECGTNGDPSIMQVNESELALLWGSLICYHRFQHREDLLPISDLIETLDKLLETRDDTIAGLPRSTWQALLGATLITYDKLLPFGKSRISETNRFLHLAKVHRSSPHVLFAAAEFLDSTHNPIWNDRPTIETDTDQSVLQGLGIHGTVDYINTFTDNLGVPNKTVRLSTLRILFHYAPLNEDALSNDEQPHKKQKREKSGSSSEDSQYINVIEVLRSIETVPLSISTSRRIAILISRLQMGLTSGRIYVGYIPLVLNGVIGILHNRFSHLWEPAIECLATLTSKYKELIWDGFVQYLENCQFKALASHNQSMGMNSESSLPDSLSDSFRLFVEPVHDSTPCATVTNLLLQTLQKIPDIAESRSRNLMPLFFKFMGYAGADISSVELFNRHDCKGKDWSSILKEWLNLLRLFCNARSLYRSQTLKEVLINRLLDEIDPDVQSKVLDCLLNWRDDFLIPYEQHIKNLIVSKNLREELTTWAVSKESQYIQEGHRGDLIPLVIRILSPKVRKLKALGSSKHAGVNHRRAVLCFLAQLDINELQVFFSLLLKPIVCSSLVDEVIHSASHSPSLLLEDTSIPVNCSTLTTIGSLDWKKRYGFLHVVEDILRTFDGSHIKPFLNSLMAIVVRLLESCSRNHTNEDKHIPCDSADNSNTDFEGHRTSATAPNSSMVKDLRSLCLKIISVALHKYESHDFGSGFWDIFFSSVKPLIDSFKQEGSSSERPSSLFSCFVAMSRSPILVSLLNREANLVPSIFSILTVRTASDAIISSVLNFIENLLSLDNDLDPKEDDSVQRILSLHLETLIHNFHGLFLYRKEINRKSAMLLGKTELRIFKLLAKHIHNPLAAGQFVDILLPIFKKKSIDSDECLECLDVIKGIVPFICHKTSEKFLDAVHPLLLSVELDLRLCICGILNGLAHSLKDHSLSSLAKLLCELNATSSSDIGEIDYDTRVNAYDKIKPELFTLLSVHHALAILSHCVYDMSSEELIFRQSASRSLLSFVQFASSILSRNTSHDMPSLSGTLFDKTYLIDETTTTNNNWTKDSIQKIIRTTFLGSMGNAMSKDTSIQKEWIALLRDMVCILHEIPTLNSLRPLCSEDAEVDFFNNILHLQVHRRRRALIRFTNVVTAGNLEESITMKIFVPLFFNMMLDVKDGKGEHLREACVESLASIAGQMQWKSYNTFLMRCFREMAREQVKQKIMLRLICAVIDKFHFYDSNSSQVVEGSGSEVMLSGNVGGNSCAALSTNGVVNDPSKIHNYLETNVLPQIQKLLTSDSEKVNVNISLAALKLLKLLPAETLESQLPSIIHRICNFLKHRLESIRDEARSALAACAKELGLEYLHYIVKVLRGALKRGYELHVLGYTLNFILSKTLTNPIVGKLDYCLEELLSIAESDILGDVGEEKEVDKIASKMKETRKNKSFETLKLISQSVTFRSSNLLKLLSPVDAHLHKHLTPKTKSKLEIMLHNIALGIEANPSTEKAELFIFVYALIQDNIIDPHGKATPRTGTDHQTIHELASKRISTLHDERRSQNSYLFVVFALGILHNRLKSKKIDKKDKNMLSMLDPFVGLLGECLNSKSEDVLTAAFRCLAPLTRLSLPSLEAHADQIKISLLGFAQNSKDASSPLVQSCLKLLTVLLQSTRISLSTDQLHMLIQFPLFIDIQSNPSPVALSLLKSIIGRRLVVSEIYDVVTHVAEMMVTSQSESIRKKCGQIFLQFLLDYRLSDKRLLQHLDFLLANLGYEHSSGREAILEMIHAILIKFPGNVIDRHAKIFFVQLVYALDGEVDQKVHSMIATVIKELIGRTGNLGEIIDYSLAWYKGDRQSLWSAAAQVLGLLVEVLKKDFQKHIDNTLRTAKSIMEMAINACYKGIECSNEHVTPFWKEAYYSLFMLEKMLIHFPELYSDRKFEEIWEMVIKFLLHPHIWLRDVSSRLVALYFAAVSEASGVDHRKTDLGSLYLFSPRSLFMIAISFVNQLRAPLIDDARSNLITQNLVFSIRGLHSFLSQISLLPHEFWSTLDSREQGSYLEGFDLLGSIKAKNIFLVSTNILAQCSGKLDQVNNGDCVELGTLLVLPIIRRMGKIALQMKDTQMKIVFNCFKMISLQLASEGCHTYAVDMLHPLYKVCEGFSGKVITDEAKQLADEVRDSMRNVLGVDRFVSIYNAIRKDLKERRDKRRTEQKLIAVINPMRHAKRKLRTAEKHRAHKKRKLAAMKIGRWRR